MGDLHKMPRGSVSVSKSSPSGEKQRYWERQLHTLLRPIPIIDLLVLSWVIEAFRNGRTTTALRRASFPGEPEEHQLLGKYFIPPWDIDAVINEKLVVGTSSQSSDRRLNLESWGAVAKLFNIYKGLANVESTMDFRSNDIMAAMPRLFWPQYDWQIGFENAFRLGRAWYVYVTPPGRQAFEAKHGIDLDVFLKVAFAIYAATAQNPAIKISAVEAIGFTRRDMARVSNAIGGSVGEHAELARSIRTSRIPRCYMRSAIKERPLIEIPERGGNALLVPSREYLLLRITDGLYYDIVQDSDARRVSGENFEGLCALVLGHYCGSSCSVEGDKDTSYGKSADIFIMENDSDLGLIVECKIRRIPQKILTSPDPWRECEADFEDIVKGIVQVWRSHDELTLPSGKNMVGVVLQYDPWTVMGNAFLEELFNRADDRADRLSIPKESRVPVALVGYSDFELCLETYSFRDIHDAVSRSTGDDFRGYVLSGILESTSEKVEEKPAFDYMGLAEHSVPWWGDFRPPKSEVEP